MRGVLKNVSVSGFWFASPVDTDWLEEGVWSKEKGFEFSLEMVNLGYLCRLVEINTE